MKKVKGKMNKQIYLGQAILDISKTLMYEFWYDYIKPKYEDKARLSYMDADSFDTSNYDKKDERPLPVRKNKKVISLFKDELDGKIIKEFAHLDQKHMHI